MNEWDKQVNFDDLFFCWQSGPKILAPWFVLKAHMKNSPESWGKKGPENLAKGFASLFSTLFLGKKRNNKSVLSRDPYKIQDLCPVCNCFGVTLKMPLNNSVFFLWRSKTISKQCQCIAYANVYYCNNENASKAWRWVNAFSPWFILGSLALCLISANFRRAHIERKLSICLCFQDNKKLSIRVIHTSK